MQINDASKMIFVHIPRTGGSWFTYSWNNDRSARYFWHSNDVLINSKTHSKVEIGRHGRLSGIKKQLAVIDVKIEEFKVVTLVREPIDRIVSAWKWFSIVKEVHKHMNKYHRRQLRPICLREGSRSVIHQVQLSIRIFSNLFHQMLWSNSIALGAPHLPVVARNLHLY